MVGGGGREHALVRTLLRSPQRPRWPAAPGNAGIARDGVECLDAGAEDVRRARRRRPATAAPTWWWSGPRRRSWTGSWTGSARPRASAPSGPSAAAARIEGSKTYAKELMRDCGVPTAGHVVLRDREEAPRTWPAPRTPPC